MSNASQAKKTALRMQQHRDEIVPDCLTCNQGMRFQVVFVRVVDDQHISREAGDRALHTGTTAAAMVPHQLEVVRLPHCHIMLGGKAGNDRLRKHAKAVARYMDYDAIALWARPALERGPELPQEVARELRRRCPGYLDTLPKNKATILQNSGQEWDDLNTLDWRPLLSGYDAQVVSGADEDVGGSRYVRNGQDGVRLFP